MNIQKHFVYLQLILISLLVIACSSNPEIDEAGEQEVKIEAGQIKIAVGGEDTVLPIDCGVGSGFGSKFRFVSAWVLPDEQMLELGDIYYAEISFHDPDSYKALIQLKQIEESDLDESIISLDKKGEWIVQDVELSLSSYATGSFTDIELMNQDPSIEPILISGSWVCPEGSDFGMSDE